MSPHTPVDNSLHRSPYSAHAGNLIRGKYLGVVQLGDTFSFSLDPTNDFYASNYAGDAYHVSAASLSTDDIAWWDQTSLLNPLEPSVFENLVFDVIDNNTQTPVIHGQHFEDFGNVPGEQDSSATDWEGVLFAKFSVDDTDFSVGGYTIKVYGFADGTDSASFTTYLFNVLHMSHEKEASIIARRLDMLRYNQEWIINDIENVVFPRLKRILGLNGENLLTDYFAYDNAGNIVSFRMRLFDTPESCQAATPDVEATDTPEEGELWSHTFTQAHNLPRNTRTEHKGIMDYNGGSNHLEDMWVTDNFKNTDMVVAPRNVYPRDNTWPNEGDTYTGNFYMRALSWLGIHPFGDKPGDPLDTEGDPTRWEDLPGTDDHDDVPDTDDVEGGNWQRTW